MLGKKVAATARLAYPNTFTQNIPVIDGNIEKKEDKFIKATSNYV
jgi:hypothetical protein